MFSKLRVDIEYGGRFGMYAVLVTLKRKMIQLVQYKSSTQPYILRTHKPKILNQNFVKQPALGSLSSFSGKYKFLNLDLQALVKEPALSDGRLQPGDKLLAANGVELASFSHQEVIILMVLLMMVNHH